MRNGFKNLLMFLILYENFVKSVKYEKKTKNKIIYYIQIKNVFSAYLLLYYSLIEIKSK